MTWIHELAHVSGAVGSSLDRAAQALKQCQRIALIAKQVCYAEIVVHRGMIVILLKGPYVADGMGRTFSLNSNLKHPR